VVANNAFGLESIAFDPQHLWFDDVHGVVGMAPDGSAGSNVTIPWSGVALFAIATTDTQLFVGTDDARILVAPKKDGATLTTFAHTLRYPTRLHVDGSNLYVLSGGTGEPGGLTKISRYATDGSSSTDLVPVTGPISDFAVRGDYVYYTFSNDSSVYRVCK
jgi:hypothetical protein